MIKTIDIKSISDRKTFCNRKWFNKSQIECLAESIKSIGLQNPIIIRRNPNNDGYQLISGETRIRAIELLRKKEITARIVELEDEEAERWSFESNLFHEGGHLHPIEQGYFFRKLSDRGLKYEKIGKKYSLSVAAVSQYISLTRLSDEIQQIFFEMKDKFKISHGLQIVKLSKYDEKYQISAWKRFQDIRDPRKRKIEALEKIVNKMVKDIELETSRIIEMENILKSYWNQDHETINMMKNRFENLGFNNDQIRTEIQRLNERHQMILDLKKNNELDIEFISELEKWIEDKNPTNETIRSRIHEYIEEKSINLELYSPKIHQTIYIKSSEHLSDIKDETVHLVITSPPYWNLKDYGVKNQIGFQESFEDYIKRVSAVFKECNRVLVSGGRLCINVGDVFISTKKYGRYKVWPIHARLIIFCESIGLDYVNSIFWKKIGHSIGGGGIIGGIFGSYPYPPNGIINNDIEYILIFKKPGSRERPSNELLELHKFDKNDWMRHHSQIWDIKPVSQKKGHPAVFPEEIPRRLIRMFTFQGENVLDPFLGTGTTSKVAYEMNRNSLGYEINPRFTSLIKQKCPNALIISNNGTIIQNQI